MTRAEFLTRPEAALTDVDPRLGDAHATSLAAEAAAAQGQFWAVPRLPFGRARHLTLPVLTSKEPSRW